MVLYFCNEDADSSWAGQTIDFFEPTPPGMPEYAKYACATELVYAWAVGGKVGSIFTKDYLPLLIGCACYCPLWPFMPTLYDM